MKSFMKKVIMSALALAIVMIGIVSRTEVVKADVSNAWDDNGTWVFKIIPKDEKLILTKTGVSGHKPNTAFCNAKLLYSYHNNEPTEIFIGDNAFSSNVAEVTTVTTVTIETECIDREGVSKPAGILNIGDSAFECCHELTEFNCQRNVKIKIIGNYSFGACTELKTIDLTEVENIGNAAFCECEYLEKIKFNKVNSIGYRAFYNCRSLQEVDFGEWVEDTECNIDENAFEGVGSVGGENNPVLILPDGWTGDEPDENGEWHGGYFRYIKSMSISDDTIVLTEEESKQLTVETSPIESENKAVTWSSSDESVAAVDENGKVTAVSAGNATITVTSTIDERKTVTCNVTVNHDFSESEYIPVDGNMHKQQCKYCDAYSTPESCKDSLVPVAKVDATCEKAGNIAYYVCDKCGVYYSDAEATTVITAEDLVIAATKHSLSKVDKVDAKCTTAGCKEYWKCTNAGCGKIFADKDGNTETTLLDLAIVDKGHTWNADYTVDVEATTTAAGSKSIHCSICGEIKEGSTVTIPKKKDETPGATDNPSGTPGATDNPSGTPGATNNPSETPGATDNPSGTPGATNNPSETPGATDTPSGTPSQTPTTSAFKVGDKVTDTKSKANYKITSVGKTNTVAYLGTTNKKATSVTVPSTVKIAGKTYKVTSIAANAFKNNKKITKVTVRTNVTAIGKNAFKGCSKLKTITIKSKKLTAKGISKGAFAGLKKGTTIKVPKSKLKAYKKLFKSKGLSSKVKVK